MFFKKNITSEQIALWIRRRFKRILFAFSFAVLLALALIVWSQWIKNQEKQVQESLYQLQKTLHTLVKNSEGITKEKALESVEPDKRKTSVFNQEMKDQAYSYEQAIRQHQKSRTSVVFAMDLADFYYQRGEVEKAKQLLSLFVFPAKPSSIYHLASFQLSSYYMDTKECEKALEILSQLSLNKKAAPFHLESDLQQALCLEHLNRYDQAFHKYESVINKDPEGYTGRLAQDYKKLLILNKSLKKEK